MSYNIHLNKVIGVIIKIIPSLKGKFVPYIHRETTPFIGQLPGTKKTTLSFIFDGTEIKDKDIISLIRILRYCGLPELQRHYYPEDTLKYHLTYDVTDYNVIYEYEKLMEQIIQGGGP